MPYGTFEPDEASWPVVKAVCASIAAILCIALVGFIVSADVPRKEDVPGPDPSELVIYTGNAAAMHEYGLPTKADVMEWHLHGQWGYYQDGVLHAFADLPGRNGVWDALYGIESNPNFDK